MTSIICASTVQTLITDKADSACNQTVTLKQPTVLKERNNITAGLLSFKQASPADFVVLRIIKNCIFLADEPTGALDSMTADEIMQIFERLNMSGKTVIIVTHDKDIAARCKRVIELSDGEIAKGAN